MPPRYICQWGLPQKYADFGNNKPEDLSRYLAFGPFPDYRLVSCQLLNDGNYNLVWELKDPS
jgi:hypothetical protein